MKAVMTSFNGGEISPKLRNRVDLEITQRGCLSLRNMTIDQLGGVKRRPGLQWVTDLSAKPTAIQGVRWSDGNFSVLLDYGTRLEIRSPEGSVIRNIGYEGNGGTPKFFPINDVVYITNRYNPPMQLRRTKDATFELSTVFEISDKVPLDENWYDKDLFVGYDTTVGWRAEFGRNFDQYVTGSQKGAYGLLDGIYFYPSEIMGVKIQADRQVSVLSEPVPPDANLKLNSYAAGYKLRGHQADGKRAYWESIREWTANPNAITTDNLDLYPYFFRKGWVFGQMEVGGGFNLSVDVQEAYVLLEIQESFDNGKSWATRLTLDTTGYKNIKHRVTGSNDGDIRLMRALLIAHDADRGIIDIINNEKPTFEREAALNLYYLYIDTIMPNGFVFWAQNSKTDPPTGYVSSWDLQAFRKQSGYPTLATFFDGRLVFAGVPARPQTLWFSASDDLSNFQAGSHDDSAMVLTLKSTQQSAIKWMEAQKQLYVGTADNEWTIHSGNGGAITVSNNKAERHSDNGGLQGLSLVVNSSVVFVERGGRRLRTYRYNYETDGFISNDLNVFAPHILEGKVKAITKRTVPQTEVTCVMEDGKAAVMTFNEQHNIVAWARMDLADGKFIDCTTINVGSSLGDYLYFVVERDGKYTLEMQQDNDVTVDGVRLVSGKWTGTPYVSEVMTTYMDSSQSLGVVRKSVEVAADFETAQKSSLRITNSPDGEWVVLGEKFGESLSGWVDMTAAATWGKRFTVGVRVEDDSPLSILSITAQFS